MRSHMTSLVPRLVSYIALLALLLAPVGASASIFDRGFDLQTLVFEFVDLLGGEEAPASSTDKATAGADPNGAPEPADDDDG